MIITVLKQKEHYRVIFFAYCSPTMFFFMCSEPTDAPTDLRVSKVESTRANIHWKPVDMKSVQGEFKEYRVRLAVFVSFMKLAVKNSL